MWRLPSITAHHTRSTCTADVGCAAVSLFWNGTDYKSCRKSDATNLTASPVKMPQACLGTLVKLAPPPSPSCTTAAVAPAGWTFHQQQDCSNCTIVCRELEGTAPASWPQEQTDACAAMPYCHAVSYDFEYNASGVKVFCYKAAGYSLEDHASDYMPEACMGIMVKDGERIAGCEGWGGWRRL